MAAIGNGPVLQQCPSLYVLLCIHTLKNQTLETQNRRHFRLRSTLHEVIYLRYEYEKYS